MSILDSRLPFLKPLSVEIQGAWETERSGRGETFRGHATASEPIVALLFAKTGKTFQWCKSGRGNTEGLQILFGMGLSGFAHVPVHVGFHLGGSAIQYSTAGIETTTFKTDLIKNKDISTGCFTKLFAPADKHVFGCMFLAAEDVKNGRNHLWHIRPTFQDQIPQQLNKILSYGRAGEIQDG